MCDTCDDNRFELIKKYKQKLLDTTNIKDSPEEMAVIDNILFRFWQMGWLMNEQSARGISAESIIDTITTVIDATDGDSPYDVGLRNGMRWCRQLFDKKEPEYERVFE